MKKGQQLKIYNPRMLQKLIASQEAQAYAMMFLSFFALAFFTLFAIRPTLNSYVSLRKQISEAREINSKLDDKINMLLAAQQTYQAYQTEIALLDKALPENPRLAQLIQKLEEIINEKNSTATAFSASEVTLLDVSPVGKASIPGEGETNQLVIEEMPVESIGFSLEMLSDYRNNESVLRTMLDLKRMITLTNLQFTIEGDETTPVEDSINTIMTADAHYLPKNTQ